MVWNAYKGLGRAMNVPYSLNMTCCKMEMLFSSRVLSVSLTPKVSLLQTA